MSQKSDILLQLIEKYKLSLPIELDIKEKIYNAKNKIFVNILKENNVYSIKNRLLISLSNFIQNHFGITIETPGTLHRVQLAFSSFIIILAVGAVLVIPKITLKKEPITILAQKKGIVTFFSGKAYVTEPGKTKKIIKLKDTITPKSLITTKKNRLSPYS